MRIKIFYTTLFVLFFQASVFAQQCRVDAKAFGPGEVVKYSVSYNWGFMWLNAGEVEFTVSSSRFQGRDAYHLYAWGTSFRAYDRIFRVRQKYQAYVDPTTLMPFWFERDVVEGNYTAIEHYNFDYNNNLIHTNVQKRSRPAVAGTVPITPCLLDVLSAVYYFRSVDFSRYRVGDRIPLNMVIDSELYQLQMRYLGKEEIQTRGRTKFNCLKFAVQVVEGTIFKAGEEVLIWVTDDNNKVPVMVEAPILVGAVKAILTDATGLVH